MSDPKKDITETVMIEDRTKSFDNDSKRKIGDSVTVEERLQALTQACPPFYKNRNLLKLYLLIIPGCLVPAITLGFDSAMMNGLQAVPAWESCESER